MDQSDCKVIGSKHGRIQKRVTTGEVTPLNINLPSDGVFLAFSQPLQSETDKAHDNQLQGRKHSAHQLVDCFGVLPGLLARAFLSIRFPPAIRSL